MGKIILKSSESRTKGELAKILCSKCKMSTNHLVLVSAEEHGQEVWVEEGFSIEWNEDYQVVRCQGCDTRSFRQLLWFSEDVDPADDESGTTEWLWPKRSAETRPVRDFWNVPKALRRIYRESIDAFNYECHTLCAGGLRAVVEGLCADQSVTEGPVEILLGKGTTRIDMKSTLEGKIAGLQARGILTESQAQTLHAHRFLGNDALHQLSQPAVNELILTIDIIEHTLEQLYEIPDKTSQLKAMRTNRTSPKDK